MAALDPLHVVDVNNGKFDRTTAEDLARAFTALEATGRDLTIHVHGGLVSRRQALASLDTLRTALEPETWPLFVVWNSDVLSTAWNNLAEIAEELFAEAVIDQVSALVGRTLGEGLRSGGDALDEDEVADELARDPKLQRAVDEVLAPPAVRGRARSSLVDPEVVDDLLTPLPPTRSLLPGLGLWIKLARYAIRITRRVIHRRQRDPTRPLTATVVEEVLRSFYLGAVGGAFWSAMKQDTLDTFGPGGAGRLLLGHVADWWRRQPGRRVTLVGHSTGAIWISHFLERWSADGFRLDVVLQGAACTFELLHRAMATGRVARIRLFGLSDALEQGYWEVPFLYPASLLYLVSGLAEPDADTPLVGLQRFWDPELFPADRYPTLAALRSLVPEDARVWSIDERAPDRRCRAAKHGDLNDEPTTLESLRWLVTNPGWAPAPAVRTRTTRGAEECDVLAEWRRRSKESLVKRVTPTTFPGEEVLRAAIGQVDITREIRAFTTGYGPLKARRTEGWLGRMRATLALLEDPAGGRLLIVGLDLHAGSRLLAEVLGARLAPIGLSVDRIFLTASHTHNGQAGFHGVPVYDRLAASLTELLTAGFDELGTGDLVAALVDEARDLSTRLQPARVGVGVSDPRWELVWNRSGLAHDANFFEPTTQTETQVKEVRARLAALGVPLPVEGLPRAESRVRVLRIAPDGHPAGVFAWVGATPTLVPWHCRVFSPDANGVAALAAERSLGNAKVAVVGGGLGDSNFMVPGVAPDVLAAVRAEVEEDEPEVGKATALRLIRLAGEALAEAVVEATRRAEEAAVDVSRIVVRFTEPTAPHASGPIDPVDVPAHLGCPDSVKRYTLPCEWRIGRSMLSASELNRDPGKESRERTARLEAGQPVVPQLSQADWGRPLGGIEEVRLQGWADFFHPLGKAGLDPFVPLRIVSLIPNQSAEAIHLVGVPAEPSTQWERDLREALKPTLRGSVIVAGLCGGYLGYACTVAEYLVQDYEGASSYWGRHFGAFVRQELVAMAPRTTSTRPPEGEALFIHARVPDQDLDTGQTREKRTGDPVIRLSEVALPSGAPASQGAVRLEGSWNPKRRPRAPGRERGWPIPGDQPFIRLMERRPDGGLHPVPELDDRHHPFAVWFDRGRWHWYAEIPAAAVSGRGISFDIPADPDLRPITGSIPPAPVFVP